MLGLALYCTGVIRNSKSAIMLLLYLELKSTWGIQVLRSPNLFKKNYSPQEAENAVISQRNHPVDIHIFHNTRAMIAWPQQTLL